MVVVLVVVFVVVGSGCTLIIGDRHHSSDFGADHDGSMFGDGGGDAGGAGGGCIARSSFRVSAVEDLGSFADAAMIESVGGGRYLVAYVYANQLWAILLNSDTGGGIRTEGPVSIYSCQQQCTMPRISKRQVTDDLILGVLDGLTPKLISVSAELAVPSPSPMPLSTCSGASSFDVLGTADAKLVLGVCSNHDLTATGNDAGSLTLIAGRVLEVRGQGASDPAFVAWATTDSQVFLGTVVAGTGQLGNMLVADPGSAAMGLGFDVMAGATDQALVAYSLGNGSIKLAAADLAVKMDEYGSIAQAEAGSTRVPVSVAAAPSSAMRTHPLFLVAFTSVPSLSAPMAAAQAVDVHAALMGAPLFPTTLESHSPQIAYAPELDQFAMTWLGPESPSAASEQFLHVAFLSCAP